MPHDGQLWQDTQTVFTDDDWNQIKPINQGDYDTVAERHPGPSRRELADQARGRDRPGEPDLRPGARRHHHARPAGNGDPADAQFGAQVTPNAHALANRFGDLDNFYDEGTLSADGHNWIVQAEANDYVEKEFGAFYRSYPSQAGDALAYQRDGFLWNAAEKAGLNVQNFGEYIYNPYSLPSDAPEWDQWYAESQWLEDAGTRRSKGPEPISDPCQYTKAQSDIPSLQAITDPCFPNFQLSIPDQYRVDQWLPVFEQQEKSGRMPNLSFMWLMTDHTTGTDVPDPVAQVADNDLAVGRVIDTISHSKFWKSTAIFIVEDDTQNGVDHVDGHRGPAFVVSPYSASGVDDSYYTQLNMVKTIEQILGIQPMNQEDLAAEPMYGAFTDSIRTSRRTTVQPNQIPLTLGAPGLSVRRSPRRQPAPPRPSARHSTPQGVVPADMQSIYKAWKAWSAPAGRRAPLRRSGPRQPGADEPVRLVLGPRLARRVSGRSEDLQAEPGARPEPAGRLHRRRLIALPKLLDVICLACPREGAREAELLERRLGHAFDAGRVGSLAAGVGIVGETADLDRVLRRAVSGDADQVEPERLAERVQAGGDDRLLVHRVVRSRRREEPGRATVRHERGVDAATRGRNDRQPGATAGGRRLGDRAPSPRA